MLFRSISQSTFKNVISFEADASTIPPALEESNWILFRASAALACTDEMLKNGIIWFWILKSFFSLANSPDEQLQRFPSEISICIFHFITNFSSFCFVRNVFSYQQQPQVVVNDSVNFNVSETKTRRTQKGFLYPQQTWDIICINFHFYFITFSWNTFFLFSSFFYPTRTVAGMNNKFCLHGAHMSLQNQVSLYFLWYLENIKYSMKQRRCFKSNLMWRRNT